MYISNEGDILERFFRINFRLSYFSAPSSGMDAIQMYLCDQERAGGYFVDGGMYASLAMHLLGVVLAFRNSSENEPGTQKENDGLDTSNNMVQDDEDMPSPSPDDEEILEFAISTLPFYLSNAEYNPKLAELSLSMLDQKMEDKLPKLHEEIGLLCEVIDQYLKKEPITPNDAQLNESQAVAERLRADKRRRESNDDLEVTGAPALSSTSKRTKVMDELSPTEVLGPDPGELMCL
ncbi:hypothetical protein GALMADRAFT_1249467 [Galerina marginata CBS 339.88]|uniref:Uncharacterized protein n=1 Tax=Galerina marginata (strain CBS 339.88) TaxID=685588 RepID=A0A067T5H3_GALM3|nr:hypothetical protein GALMADRAFT_1249467 [Galerina marginata CBS 339.88]